MKIVSVILKSFATLLLCVIALAILTCVSPIYKFQRPEPFSGENIYNPYAVLDTAIGWSRANFHTHTKVDKGINECPEYPDVVWADYQKYGYDILSFSNHNALTEFPGDTSRQIWVYEHGWNPLKFHKLVFFSDSNSVPRVLPWDNLFPIFPSQKQFMLDLLARDADFLVFNHPDRTFCVSEKDMERVTGYRFIEAYAGKPTAMRHWDEALSAGHYSFCLISDDCHDSGNPQKIAIRCSWLNTDSHRWEDVREVLLSGCFYTMSLPSWEEEGIEGKIDRNRILPGIKNIALQGDTINLSLTDAAEYIKFIGQDGFTLDSIPGAFQAQYILPSEEPYARIEAAFPEGIRIYTNAFARYSLPPAGGAANLSYADSADSEVGSCSAKQLFAPAPHGIRPLPTILFNLALLILIALCATLIRRLWKPRQQAK